MVEMNLQFTLCFVVSSYSLRLLTYSLGMQYSATKDVFADGVQTALNGIIKGCGRQCIIMPIVLIAYWVGGVPLAYYLAFIRNDGDMSCSDSRFCGDVALVAG